MIIVVGNSCCDICDSAISRCDQRASTMIIIIIIIAIDSSPDLSRLLIVYLFLFTTTAVRVNAACKGSNRTSNDTFRRQRRKCGHRSRRSRDWLPSSGRHLRVLHGIRAVVQQQSETVRAQRNWSAHDDGF